ncbi:hypothetical protein DUI87_11412 [Hirundo rustica rustica]|uniref:Phosphoseryl-tRNA kinase n=1 Tax=Hirundo rustica rustica TaxID=333673 RepID=A0A3M0KDJ8_HIRRU|nr:hypothetical protein DUI87_11412 [Hirundo rustica rustica]
MRTAPAEAAGAAALAAAEQQQRRRGSGCGARVGLCLLCGLPAAGKSTLARALSRRLPRSPGWACALLAYDELIPPEAFRPRAPGAGPHEPSPLVSAAALIGRSGALLLRHWVRPRLPGNETRLGLAGSPHGGAAQQRRCGALISRLSLSTAARLEAEPPRAAAVPGGIPAGAAHRGGAARPRAAGLGAFPGCCRRQGLLTAAEDDAGAASRPLLLLLDDNFYYQSMRYEVYQLARKCNYSVIFGMGMFVGNSVRFSCLLSSVSLGELVILIAGYL